MSKANSSPTFSLGKAISYADKAYEAVGKGSVSADTFYNAMGYSGKSGASMKAIAALRHYGLLDGRAEDVQLSELYMRIVRPLDPNEKYLALREASMMPTVFSELTSEFEKLPPPEILKSIAIRRYGFTESGAEKLTKVLNSTLEYVSAYSTEVRPPNADEHAEYEQDKGYAGPATQSAKIQNAEESAYSVNKAKSMKVLHNEDEEVFQFRLTKSSSAEVRISGEITESAIRRLITHLEFTAEIYSDSE